MFSAISPPPSPCPPPTPSFWPQRLQGFQVRRRGLQSSVRSLSIQAPKQVGLRASTTCLSQGCPGLPRRAPRSISLQREQQSETAWASSGRRCQAFVHTALYWRLVLQEPRGRAGPCEWSLPGGDQGRPEPLVPQLPPISQSQWRRHCGPVVGDGKVKMLKFKAFCLDYWQFLCLQPLHGVYRR